MHLKFFLSFIVLISVTSLAGQNKIKWASWDSAADKIEAGNKKFLVYFYYDGCRWCRFMEDNTFSVDYIARFVNQNFHPFRVNALSKETIVADKSYTSVRVGKYEFHELATELLVGNMSFPSVVFLDEQFKKLGSYDSYMDVQSFEMILSYYAGDHHKRTMWKRFANNYCRDSHFNSLVNDKN
jgi:thioredoxin-related protein